MPRRFHPESRLSYSCSCLPSTNTACKTDEKKIPPAHSNLRAHSHFCHIHYPACHRFVDVARVVQNQIVTQQSVFESHCFAWTTQCSRVRWVGKQDQIEWVAVTLYSVSLSFADGCVAMRLYRMILYIHPLFLASLRSSVAHSLPAQHGLPSFLLPSLPGRFFTTCFLRLVKMQRLGILLDAFLSSVDLFYLLGPSGYTWHPC